MPGRRRRDLTASFRLLATDERWLLTDLILGAFAYVIWVAVSGTVAAQVVATVGLPPGLGADPSPTVGAVGLLAVLWIVLPSVAVLARLRQRLHNLRGNVQQYYRLDHPAALLAPPALFVAVAVPAVELAPLPEIASLVLVPVGLFLLVRTLAYSYRVYAFSRPGLVQTGVLVATAAALAGALGVVAGATGRSSVLEGAVVTLGAPASLLAPVSAGGFEVAAPVVAMLASVGFAAVYVALQTVVALLVRLVKPTVDRASMRSGQRYPPFLESATTVQPGGSGAGPTPEESREEGETAVPDGTTHEEPAAAGTQASGGADDTEATGDADEAADDGSTEADLDDVSNTRVFTPPADGEDVAFDGSADGEDPGKSVGDEPDDGRPHETTDETRSMPDSQGEATGNGVDGREHCDICGESFSVDTAVRFCPNCGSAFDAQ